MVVDTQDSGVCLSMDANSPTTSALIGGGVGEPAEFNRQVHPLSGDETIRTNSDSPTRSRDVTKIDDSNDKTFAMTVAAVGATVTKPPDDESDSPPVAAVSPSSTSNVTAITENNSGNSDSRRPSAVDDVKPDVEPSVIVGNGYVIERKSLTDGSGSASSSSTRQSKTSAQNAATTPRSAPSSHVPPSSASLHSTLTPTKTFGQRFVGAIGKLTGKSKHQPTKHTPSSTVTSPAAAATTKISPQDQKILTIMRERKAAEAKEREQREKKHSEWEQDNRRQSTASRQQSAVTSNHLHQALSASSGSRGVGAAPRASSGGRDFVRPQLSVVSNNSSVLETDDNVQRVATPTDRLATLDSSVDNIGADSRRTSVCSSMSSLADGRLNDPLRARVLHNMEKKRSVEQRLQQQRREMEEHAKQLKAKQEQDLQRANSLRLSREQQHAMRARLANEKVQQKREIMSKQKQQSMSDLTARQEAIDSKLAAAELKVQKRKEEELQRTRSELQRRLEMSRQRQKQMEDELETWRAELIKFNQWQGDNAEKVAQQNKVSRGVNACKMRLEKEKKQQDNMKRLMSAEEKRLADIEATIETKDTRTSVLLKEKEEVVLRSRERALATKQLREELRAHYSMNDIDQLNRQVAMENRLMSRIPGSSQTSLNTSITSLASPTDRRQ